MWEKIVRTEETTDDNKRPLPDKTHHSQNTDIHARGGIRTRNNNKREDTDPRL